jgi:aspartate racemase
VSTLGIVGGIGPPSTVAYYRTIVDLHRGRCGRPPRVVIDSIDGDELVEHLAAGDRHAVTTMLVGALDQLARAGADLALLASASAHTAYDEVRSASPLPLVGIVEATAAGAVGCSRVGIFGTRFTMRADLFGPALAAEGIATVAPSPQEQEAIDRVYFDELVGGRFRPESRDALRAIAVRLRDESGVDGILLAGTELPLLLPETRYDDLVYLDVARLHAEAAVEAMLD